MYSRRNRTLASIIILILACGFGLPAGQPLVKTVNRHVPLEDFAAAWGVTATPETYRNSFGNDGKVAVMLRACSIPANVLWPGDQATFTFQFENLTNRPLKKAGKVHIIRYQTYTPPGPNFFLIGIRKLKDVGSVPIAVDLKAKGWQDVTVTPPIPETFGGYALIIELDGHDRLFGASCVRTFKPQHRKRRFYKLTVDMRNIDILVRLGVTPNRLGVGYVPTTSKNFEKWYAEFSGRMQELHKAGRTTTLEFGAGAAKHQPLDRYRKWLNEDDVMRVRGKDDRAWLPAMDPDFRKFVERICSDFGWPKGPVNGVMLWNEPWEGISISGWGADMIRYRNIFTAMARGVEDAEKEAGVEVYIGGCDSSSNTFDKLFGDGSDKFLKWLDFMSIHYQGRSPHTNVRMFNDRRDAKGNPAPVQVWDTESWMANSDDRIAGTLAAMYSFGQQRVVGINSNSMVNTGTRVRLHGVKGKVEVRQTWSAGAAVGAFQHFVGERDFRELLFRRSPPYVMIFDGYETAAGKADPEDGTVVVLGDMGSIFRYDGDLFRSCRSQAEVRQKEQWRKQLAKLPADADKRREIQAKLKEYQPWRDATMTLDVPGEAFSLYDFYGNPVPARAGQIIVPLDARGFYLRGNGKPGSFGKLLAALQAGRIDGVEPLVSLAHDMTAPVDHGGAVKLTLTNVLNRPVKGRLSVTLAGLRVEHPSTLSFAAQEKQEVLVKVAGGAPRADNQYAMRMVFDAGKDGLAVHEETMRVNYIEKRTITVDGKLDDWKGVLPQEIRADGFHAASMMEKAWRPFMDFDEGVAHGLAVGYVAHDDDYFYFGVKITDSTPHAGTLRFETRDDDAYFYPKTCYEIDAKNSFATIKGRVPGRMADQLPVQGPDKKEPIAPKGWKGLSTYAAFEVKADKPTALTLAFVQWKGGYHTRWAKPTVIDAATGKELLKVKDVGGRYGLYMRFLVNGRVRLHLPMNSARGAVTGLFLDPAAAKAKSVPAPGAQWLGTDSKTGADWTGTYGKLAVWLADGTKRGQTQRLKLVSDVKKKPLHWPAGVRRYSYRKNPILPAGNAPRFDNVQIAFNVLPEDQKWQLPGPPGTMPKYINYACTDYEYALNKVAGEYGGGTEVWRLRYPGMPHKHFYPRQPKSPKDGAVKQAKLVVVHEGNTRITECAIPWSEIPWVKKRRDAGRTIKFSFKVNHDDSGMGMELSKERSVAKGNNSFHVDWSKSWANEIEFGFDTE